MKVKDLINVLKRLDQNTTVVVGANEDGDRRQYKEVTSGISASIVFWKENFNFPYGHEYQDSEFPSHPEDEKRAILCIIIDSK